MNKQYIMLDDGNKISYMTYGKGKKVVLFFHGLVGGAYISKDWKKEIEAKDITLIAIERSGYGYSSKIKMKNISQWIPIAKQIAKQLKLSKVDLVGCSAGAPYAYATASALEEIVEKVYILGGVPSAYKGSVLKHYDTSNQEAYKSFMTKPMNEIQEYYKKQLNDFKKYLKKDEDDYIEKTIDENLEQDCFGISQECKLQIENWGMCLSEIKQPIFLHHAVNDEMVPYEAAKEMTNYLQNCSFEEIHINGDKVHISSISKAFLQILNVIGYNVSNR
ncbi:alpha/beta fold hydrolase [Vallitalea guaymasensis]|uniref:alpha/beta fold hydrolase n=1 Tax=Vallitalea guaymasensis TaxID=1185412 RepID=UPI000DE533D1|nr:alpha/beta hydrolase [Vallitalea guaymasensis]